MRKVVNKSLLAIAVSGILVSPAVNATNGYFAHGYSTKEKGLAGAGTAYSQDSLAAATNPAGMAFVGERMDIGAALFSPSPRSFTLTGEPVGPPTQEDPRSTSVNAVPGTKYESDNDFFIIPHFGYNWQLNNDSTVGVSVYGNGGMNTEYPTSSSTPFPDAGVFGEGTAGMNMAQLFVNLSWAKKINAKHAFGGSLLLVGQRMIVQGVQNFEMFSVDPDNMSGNRKADSFGAGIKVGYQGEVAKGIRIGAAYQSKISMSELDEYKGLLAESGDFDIPSTYNIGVSFDIGDDGGVIVADVQRILYSDVASISNPISNLLTLCAQGDPTGCLGGANGAGFGWEDMTIYKIGYQLEDDKYDITYRVGYSHAEQPVPDSETLFNILAPAVVEDHFTAGMTVEMSGNQELNISGMYAPSNSVKGDNPFDNGSTQVEIEMSQWEIQAGWAWKY